MGDDLAQVAYTLAFGITRTTVPLGLSAYYARPADLNPLEWRFVSSGGLVVALTLVALAFRRRWPGLLAVWVSYVAMLLPAVGVVQHGRQLTADRYSYLSCLGWPLLIAAGLLCCWPVGAHDGGDGARPRGPRGQSLVMTACVGVASLALLGQRQTGFWGDSVALWSRVVACDPGSFRGQRNLGGALAEKQRFGEAIKHYERAIELNATNAAAHRGLGTALFKLGRWDEAMACYERALAAWPDYGLAHQHPGVLLFELGRLDAAAARFRRALVVTPNDSVIHNNLGVVLAAQGRMDEAIEHYRLSLRYRPDNAEAHGNLGDALFEQGKLREAERHYRLAIKQNPGYARAHNNLGLTLAEQERIDEAIRSFEEAIRLRPDDPGPHRNLARARGLARE